ncbi:immunity 53 family protein [Paenibacillus sp. IB182363]|uniref:Immunity 53 family protein n=1 Tax=Paenibacillus oceani TaxID=2772510 RepID=A0A927CC28_9BACL|nr:immunity 53 family protein [Paenibacillus oceani]
MDNIKWLQEWYFSQCDGDWEHIQGVKITTIDNPGWYVELNVTETNLDRKVFENIKIERDDSDWLYCKVENNMFVGTGGPLNLDEIIVIFREWASS